MEVITLPDLPVGGQAGPHSGDKTKDKIHWGMEMKFVIRKTLSACTHQLRG